MNIEPIFWTPSGIRTKTQMLESLADEPDPGLAAFIEAAQPGDEFAGDEQSPVDYEAPVRRIAL